MLVIDASSLMRGARSLGRFDHFELKQKLEGLFGKKFVDAYHLSAVPADDSDAQDGFNTWLKSAPPRGHKLRVQLYGLKHLMTTCQ